MSKVKPYDLDRRYPVRMAVSIHYLPDRSPMIKVKLRSIVRIANILISR